MTFSEGRGVSVTAKVKSGHRERGEKSYLIPTSLATPSDLAARVADHCPGDLLKTNE